MAPDGRMFALRWHGPQDLRLDRVEIPRLTGSTDVLLAVEACGICGSDIEEWQEGPTAIPKGRETGEPIVLGHEFCGRVVDPGDTSLTIGTLVAVEVNIPCGECLACREDRTNNCPFTVALGLQDNGGLAEFVVVPATSCVAVDEGTDPRVLAFAEPLAVAVHAVERAQLHNDAPVAVFGAGAVGILLALLLRAGGNQVVVVEPIAARRRLAERLGFAVAAPDTSPHAPAVRQFPVCFEATGNPAAVRAAVDATQAGGSIVLLGVSTRALGISAWDLVDVEVSLIPSKSHTMSDFSQAVNYLVSGEVDVRELPVGEFALESGVSAFEATLMRPGDYLKRMMVAHKGNS